MRSLLLPLAAAALMAVGCSSFSPPPAPSSAAYRTGTVFSKWGELPSYSPTPEPMAIRIERSDPDLSGEAIVDLLLNRDGRVKDWDIVSSADDDAFQRGIGIWVHDHRIGPRLTASDPDYYVLRITFAFIDPGPSRDQYFPAR